MMNELKVVDVLMREEGYPDTEAFRKDLCRAARAALREGDFYDAIRAYKLLGNKRRVNEVGERCLDEGGSFFDAELAFSFTKNKRGIARLLGFERSDLHCTQIDELLKDYLGTKRMTHFWGLQKAYKKQFSYTHDAGASFGIASAIIAAKRLSQEFDLAVGIPHGGLFSAFIFDLVGLPTYLLEAHDHKREGVKRWVKKPEESDIRDKRVLICDKDCVSGRTLNMVADELKWLGARSLGVYFNHDLIPEGSWGLGVVGENIPKEITRVYTPEIIGYAGLMEAVKELEARL